MPATTHIVRLPLDPSCARFSDMAQLVPRLRVGHALGWLDDHDAGAVCDLSRHRRARPRHAFQPGMGAGRHGFCLGRPCADHPDLDAWLRRNRGAGGDRGDRQRHPAVSDGGLGHADDADATDETASAGAGGPSHGGHLVGRMLSFPAACAARPADRVHPWPRHRSGFGLPGGDDDRLYARGQPLATARRCNPDADALGVSVLHRPQLPGTRGWRRAGAGTGFFPAGGDAEQRRRHPRQRRVRRHHCLWRALVAGPPVNDFIGDWHALVILLIAGVLPNQIWRMLGLMLGSGMDEGSELLVWVRAVATAILAGVIAQILVQPPGALASVPDWLRYAAVATGFAAFIVLGRSTLIGVVCGELLMLAGKWWLG